MRLTLRTLLAYLDDILDPADAEQLGSKIGESEFATALVKQIRGSVRSLRLSAPDLDAQGIGSELNSVAEYLDNVLPPEQVPALEKACLDDELNLGEVASCHQVLTLVLGEAAPVTDAMRKKVYGIAPSAAPAAPNDSKLYVHPAHDGPPQTSTMFVGPAAYPSDLGSVQTPEPPVSPPTARRSRESTTPAGKILRVDTPSTKETWRAEASTLAAESIAAESDVGRESSMAAPIVTPKSSRHAAPQTASVRPVRRKSSWLRSAFILGIIALLILSGLLLATGTVQENFLTRWWYGPNQVAEMSQPADGNFGQAAPPLPTQQQSNMPREETGLKS